MVRHAVGSWTHACLLVVAIGCSRPRDGLPDAAAPETPPPPATSAPAKVTAPPAPKARTPSAADWEGVPEMPLRQVWAAEDTIGAPANGPPRAQLVPDVDGDGVPELVLGSGSLVRPPRVAMFSVGTGRRLACIEDYLPSHMGGVGHVFDVGPDADGDGDPDLVVGAAPRRSVMLLAGRTGRVVREWSVDLDGFGSTVRLVPDVDGDDLADVLVGAPGARQVHLYSGKTGREVRRWQSEEAEFGHVISRTDERGGKHLVAIDSAKSVSILSLDAEAPVATIAHTGAGPSELWLDFDLTGDGTRDVAFDYGNFTVAHSGRDWRQLGLLDARIVPDADHPGRPSWEGREGLARRDGTWSHPTLTPQWRYPETLQNTSPGAVAFDETGRWLVVTDATGSSGWTTTVYERSSRPAPNTRTPARLPTPSCPLVGGDVQALIPAESAQLEPLLRRLTRGLEQFAKQPSATTAGELTALGDEEAGLWWCPGCCSAPMLHFSAHAGPHPVDLLDQTGASDARRLGLGDTAKLLDEMLKQPRWRDHLRHSKSIRHSLLWSVMDFGTDSLTAESVAALPLELQIGHGLTNCDPNDGCPGVSVYLTRRQGKLRIAHVIYDDGSA